jgi:GntR family transcriptional regulator / MocR family aminotransferase
MHAANDRSMTSGSDFLQLDARVAPRGGLADWLAGQLREAIADGRLPVGSRLPATRVLATDLRVSRGVVTEAYRRLVEDGQLAGRGRAGTVVVAAPLAAPPGQRPRPAGVAARPSGAAQFPRSFASAGSGQPSAFTGSGQPSGSAGFPGPVASAGCPEPFAETPGADVFDQLRAAPARIDLSPGVPDLAAFPRAGWLRAEREVLRRLSSADLGYGHSAGNPALRLAVSRWLARNRGITADPDEVVIVAGVAQAFAIFARILGRDGITRIAVEDPGSLGARQQLAAWGAETPPVAVDDKGVRVDELRATGAPAVLLTPAHQFPTGVVLDAERRRELFRWAADGGVILEDDYDAEHRYDRPPVPALRALLPDQVCYAGSVSKWLAPALRIGWVLAPARYRDGVVAAKRDADLGNPVLPQLVLAELMGSGEMERQLRFVRGRHRRRRDAMIAAIEARLPGAAVRGAAAGLHLTVAFSDADVSDVELAAEALARGVKTQPLSWHSQRTGPPGLVLGYAARTASEIADGVAIVGEALHELTGRRFAYSARAGTAPT